MRLTVIGCSGSFPGPTSPASCYLLEADDDTGRTWRVALDLGNGALGPLQARVAPGDLDAVLLSHLHPDHCVDVCGLYVALKYDPAGRGDRRIPVFGPAETAARLARAYGMPEIPGMSGQLDFRDYRPGAASELGPMTWTPYRVEHPVEAYGLRLDLSGTVLAYTGDTDTCPALVDLAAGADLLLAEASFQEGRETERGIHLTGRRAGELARDAGVRRLVLTHLPVWTDPAVVLAEARTVFDGPVEVAEPGSTYRLGSLA